MVIAGMKKRKIHGRRPKYPLISASLTIKKP
jgi:hypothetical protein